MPKICFVNSTSESEYNSIRSVTRNYNLFDFADRATAENALVAHPLCPLVDFDYPLLVRKPLSVVQNKKNLNNFTASATWEYFIPQEVGREILSGSISLTSQNVKNTYNHIGSYGPGTNMPIDAGGLINVTKEGADGVDVEFPVLSFSLQRSFPKGTFNLGFLVAATPFAGLPNSSNWRGFSPQTVKLSGVDGTNDDEEFDNITFSFQASPTFTNIVIPSPLGDITIPEKKGWQYLHVQSVERHDPSTGFTSWVPHTAHVDEVGPTIDLNGLI